MLFQKFVQACSIRNEPKYKMRELVQPCTNKKGLVYEPLCNLLYCRQDT